MTRRELPVLIAQLRVEIERIESTASKVSEYWSREGRTEERLAVLALHMHGFYGGVEKIFESVARNVDESVPAGPSFHRDLLAQMALDVPGLRPAVISNRTMEELRPYLELRHRVRHLYLFDLGWEDVEPTAPVLLTRWAGLRAELETFLGFLEELKPR